jgi:hypothetical protein
MDDIHPIKDFLDPVLSLPAEAWALAGIFAVLAIIVFAHALSRWRPPALATPDTVPVSDIRAEAMAAIAALPIDDVEFPALVHAETRRYLDRIQSRVLYSARTGRETTTLLDDDRVRKFEETYTASRYAESPLDHESRRRFRRLAEEIVLGIE